MIDPVTEHILMEARIMDSFKRVMFSIKRTFIKKDLKAVGMLAKHLPQKNIKQVKNEASRMPGFKQKYNEAKRLIQRSKVIEESVREPAAVAIAIVAIHSSAKVSEIIKRGETRVQQLSVISLLIPGSGFIMPLMKLMFFTLIIMSIYITAGDIVAPALVQAAKAIGLLLSIIGKAMKSLATLAQTLLDPKKTEVAVDKINDMLGTNLLPPKPPGMSQELIDKAAEAGVEFAKGWTSWGGEHLPGTAGLYFKAKK